MKVSGVFLILIFLLPAAGNATYLENLGDFSILGDLSKAVVELEVKTVQGDSQKTSFTLTDDTYQELTKYKAKNPFLKAVGLKTSDLELCVFQDIPLTSYKNLNLDDKPLWIDPSVFSFDIHVLKASGLNQDVLAYVNVKVKDEVVASGLIRDRNILKMYKKTYIDGNQQLESITVTSDKLSSERRFFEMEFEMNRTLEKQKFRVKIDLNKISYTSRLSNQNDLGEDLENTL